MKLSKGFTLMELLVSIVIFILVIIVTYALFDQGAWLHLAGQKRTNIQDNARVLIESMERDFRMIGFGVPTGTDVGGAVNYGATSWNPAVFLADDSTIGFTADIDNGNCILTSDVGTGGADRIYIEKIQHYSDALSAGNVPIVLVSDNSRWDDLLVSAIFDDTPYDALQTTANVPSPGTFTATKTEVFTLERVFYRLNPDTDNDGDCDLTYPYCTVERQEFRTNNPTSTSADADLWSVLGTNVVTLKLKYYNSTGTELDTSVATNLPLIAQIEVTLICADRSSVVRQFQTVRVSTRILVRNKAL